MPLNCSELHKPTKGLTKTQKRNLRRKRLQRPPKKGQHPMFVASTRPREANQPRTVVPAVTAPHDNPICDIKATFKLAECQVGALFGTVCEELQEQGFSLPEIAVNNHTDRWSNSMTDTTYVLLTNIKVSSVARHDDHDTLAHLPPGVNGFQSGPYKLPVLRPASFDLPPMEGVKVHKTPAQIAERCHKHCFEDLAPRHRVEITGNTVAQVDSMAAARKLLINFVMAALAAFGENTGHWSAYIGKHDDCAADGGHPDAFSRVFKMNGPSAEMARTRSCIGYGPSVGAGRKAALLTLRNVDPGQSHFYQMLGQTKAALKEAITERGRHDSQPQCAPIPSSRNATNFKGVTKMANGRYLAAIRLGLDTQKMTLGTFDTPEEAARAYATAQARKRTAAPPL